MWRYRVEVQSLRREVIVDKYKLVMGGWRTNDITLASGCGVWRNITTGWAEFYENISFKVGGWEKS